jgi:hypothetical protein
VTESNVPDLNGLEVRWKTGDEDYRLLMCRSIKTGEME